MKRTLKFVVVLSMLVIILAVSTITLNATTGEVLANELEQGTKLAQLLEQYGIPVSIAGAISGLGTGIAIHLLTKGFKNNKKQMISELKELNLTKDVLNKLIDKLDKVEKKLEALEMKSNDNMEITYNNRVIPLLNEVKKIGDDLVKIKENTKQTTYNILALLNNEEIEDLKDLKEIEADEV